MRIGHGKECSVYVLESALDALASSGRWISSLNLGNYGSDCFFYLPSLDANILTSGKLLSRIFKGSTILKLGFYDPKRATNAISDFPSQLLKMTPQVQNLTLSFNTGNSANTSNIAPPGFAPPVPLVPPGQAGTFAPPGTLTHPSTFPQSGPGAFLQPGTLPLLACSPILHIATRTFKISPHPQISPSLSTWS